MAVDAFIQRERTSRWRGGGSWIWVRRVRQVSSLSARYVDDNKEYEYRRHDRDQDPKHG